jgi:hypothetical protein
MVEDDVDRDALLSGSAQKILEADLVVLPS